MRDTTSLTDWFRKIYSTDNPEYSEQQLIGRGWTLEEIEAAKEKAADRPKKKIGVIIAIAAVIVIALALMVRASDCSEFEKWVNTDGAEGEYSPFCMLSGENVTLAKSEDRQEQNSSVLDNTPPGQIDAPAVLENLKKDRRAAATVYTDENYTAYIFDNSQTQEFVRRMLGVLVRSI